MNWQPALATSAFRGLHDELVAYVTLFCDVRELLQLSQTCSAFYVFCREEPLWMMHCLRRHHGDFFFRDSWRLTTFFPRERPADMPQFAPVAARGFASDFLYRRWCRCHMELRDFVLPDDALDPYARRVPKIALSDISYQQYFEEYSRVPFIIKDAVGDWKASTEWTPEKLVERFPDQAKHRMTHNLDFFGSGKTLQMTFRDYFQYVAQQKDETPLYIFDPNFGEKLPELLDEYRVDDLKFFKEDMLSVVTQRKDERVKCTQSTVAASTDGDTDASSDEADNAGRSTALRPDFRWLVIGPQRTGAPWHTDPARTSAWNTLVKGRKRWAIYPPDSPPPGVTTAKSGSGREHALNMTSLTWYLHVYPTLKPHEKPLEVIQEEGETIYVPSGWWHLILNLDTTVAVTQNFVDSHNLLSFMKDLLADQQDEALSEFQHRIKTTRPETFDLFRLMHIPRVHGYMTQDLFVSTFAMLAPWRAQIKKLLLRHRRALSPFGVLRADAADPKKVRVAKLRSLTSRVNPAFAVGPRVLIKLFSQFNQRWGEFEFAAYLAPDFAAIDGNGADGTASPSKRARRSVLQPHELKRAMSLRRAMEESYRIERETYAMIAAAATAPQASDDMTQLQSMVPQLYECGHLMSVADVDDEDGEGSLWRWPYVIIEFRGDLAGLDKLVAKGGVTHASWLATARWISTVFLPRLHAVPLARGLQGLHGHSKTDWDWYTFYLLCRRKRSIHYHFKEDVIPPQLMRSLAQFLPASDNASVARTVLPASAAAAPPVLLHGDLTQENILGSSAPKRAAAAPSSDLAAHLEAIGCAKYAPLLVEQEELTIASLALVDDAHLKALGIPLGPRLSILQSRARATDDDDDDAWETCSSSSEGSDTDDSGDTGEEEAASGPALQAKRQAKFLGPHEWTPSFVIDFADAKTGDPLYDLVAVFFAALNADRELWKATLDTPYWRAYIEREHHAGSSGQQLRERFLKLVLLHPSRSIKSLFFFFPGVESLSTWEELARVVFEDTFDLRSTA
ncbi:hypothetical protein PybrP1_010045 [[Pythium] brassicae (nom. inval.)]|nr:hypothetical protein PybrP1_010045 [[Pythium] brassicae (nom. inval.)]